MLPASWGSPGRYLAVIMVAILSGTALTIVTQATPSSMPRDTSIALYSASTEADICSDDAGCGTVQLDVDSTRNGVGDVLCMEITTDSRHEHGCANVTDSVRVDTDIGASAELPTTSLDLHTLACNEENTCQIVATRTVDVRASWAASGNGGKPDRAGETCTWPRSTEGEARPASANLTMDGYTIETFGDIRLVDAGPVSACDSRDA